MGLFRDAFQSIAKAAPERLPQSVGMGLLNSMTGVAMGSTPTGQLSQMQAYGTVGWIFATVGAITDAVSGVEWQLFRRRSNGDLDPISSHPLLDLWERPNPFYDQDVFVETMQQHLELTGESWTLKLRNSRGMPVELWPIRPDRMRPVPDRQEFIAYYEYRIGSERILLDRRDVIFLRRPSPLDPYRGIGVIQSLLVDLGAEKAAQQWASSFFTNGALPGGIVEVDEELDDDQFESLRLRWNQQHRGSMNAHRVAFLEKAHWKEVKLTQRDMQFEQLRRLTRDTILGAFRVPLPIMGITESVNRANAEAAEVHFARFNVKPRLRRIRGGFNAGLSMEFGSDLVLGFVDPTPRNREQDAREGVEGFNAQILTRDEARIRLGEGPAEEGGDEYKTTAATPMQLSARRLALKAPANPLRPGEVTEEESVMELSWTSRFDQELEDLVAHLEKFFGPRARLSPQLHVTTKLELADVETYDWDWWEKYGEEVVEELAAEYSTILARQLPDLAIGEIQRLSAEYAQLRGASLLQLEGEINVVQVTRERVRTLVATAVEEGQSLTTLQTALREDHVFSHARAQMVARTETATALGQGSKEVAILQGKDQKRWVTQGDDLVSTEICAPNGEEGWIGIADSFQSGHDTIPGHPNCRCVVEYRNSEGALIQLAYEARCPTCNKLLQKEIELPADLWCPRCKARKHIARR